MMPTKKPDLDCMIPILLAEAMKLIPQKGRAIQLYNGDGFIDDKIKNPYFLAFQKGLSKLWDVEYGQRMLTESMDISQQQFLESVRTQPYQIKAEIYQNLVDYINTETPKERGEVEFPESTYLMGY